jgi:hypothetical protein
MDGRMDGWMDRDVDVDVDADVGGTLMHIWGYVASFHVFNLGSDYTCVGETDLSLWDAQWLLYIVLPALLLAWIEAPPTYYHLPKR